ncbi:LacI family DNA-binding transcriptional regulator [Sediminispirochaeta smaragdinae]|uniref:Transcriptional regulator, LacI family n=1 Tax=Sediminispirochaeta smaragdinae (strain DSM 11293 / JCM 15392 / SEBR 4228) TaxID=573413 RepID=E1R149_SEDSS|nr:LacI family DNA-binding transcriptional regulator [Sediminispirochaeta smaragdinae]ADK80298.1 transcriptional regulator, LacI family [Sediminispirochaeta smaragdinae DSM 11293]
MKVTIKDIARMCGVSVTTVSRVLNNKTESIGKDTVVRIRKKIEELGYRPNSVARSMITGRSHTVGLVVPDVRNPFFSELARGVEDFMNKREYGVFLCNTDSSLDKERQYIDLLKGKFTDGIIFTTQNKNELGQYFGNFIMHDFPVVLIERYIDGMDAVPGIYVDNRGGAEKLCDFIIGKGHRGIACIAGPFLTTNARLRLEGYKDSLRKHGIAVEDRLIIESNYRYSGGYRAMKELLEQQKGRFTAVFACNDLMAYGAYKALEEEGLSVPQEMSLAGFDNIKFPEVLRPRITSVDLPAYEMGGKAAEMLCAIMKKQKLSELRYEYDLEVIDKGSVAEPL